MTIEISKVGNLWVASESSFAAGMTFTADFTALAVVEGSVELSLNREPVDPKTQQTFLDRIPTQILGETTAELSFQTVVAGSGNPATAAEQAELPNSAILWQSALGGQSRSTGTVVSAATSASKFSVTSGLAASRNLLGGTGILLNSYFGEILIVTAAAQDVLNLRIAVNATPSVGDTILGGVTYFLGENPTVTPQFVVEGYENTDKWRMLGCALESLDLEFPPGQLPIASWKWKGMRWAQVTTGSVNTPTISSFNPGICVGEFQAQVPGTVTRNLISINLIELAPAIEYIPVRSYNYVVNTSATIRWRRNRTGPAMSGSFVVPLEDTTWADAKTNSTIYSLQMVFGTGTVVAFTMPRVQVVDVQRIDQDGIQSWKVDWICLGDTTTTAHNSQTEIARSAFRVHFLS